MGRFNNVLSPKKKVEAGNEKRKHFFKDKVKFLAAMGEIRRGIRDFYFLRKILQSTILSELIAIGHLLIK